MKHEHKDEAQQNSVLLMETPDQVQTSIIEDILNQQGIASYAKARDVGEALDAYVGYSRYGDYIYVNSADLDRAKELVGEFIPAE